MTEEEKERLKKKMDMRKSFREIAIENKDILKALE